MILRKKKLLEGINGRFDKFYKDLSSLQDKIFETVECDGCGCLLKKDEKFKQPSTIEVQNVILRKYSPSYPGYVLPPSIGGTEEYIKEHYMCLRCASESSKKNEDQIYKIK